MASMGDQGEVGSVIELAEATARKALIVCYTLTIGYGINPSIG